MNQYHKIQTVYKRDQQTKKILEGEYSLPEFEYLKDNTWVFTEKVDGTNIRVMWNGQDVTFGGKSDDAQIPVFLLYKLQELFEGTAKKQLFIEKFGVSKFGDESFPLSVCLYGEGHGAKIQKGVGISYQVARTGGNYIADGVSFTLFDVKIGNFWLQRKDVEDIGKHFDLVVVPIIGEGTLDEAIKMTRKGFPSKWGDFLSEGIVARPKTELKTRSGERVITKIKHKDFK